MAAPQRLELQDISRDLDLMLSEMGPAELGNLTHLLTKAMHYVSVWRDIVADEEAMVQQPEARKRAANSLAARRRLPMVAVD